MLSYSHVQEELIQSRNFYSNAHLVLEGLVGGVVEACGGLPLEGDLLVVVDLAAAHAHQLPAADAGRAQLPPLLQRRQPPRLLQLLLAGLPLRLLALQRGIVEIRSTIINPLLSIKS